MTTGEAGECIATQFLKEKKWKIIERNKRYRFGEIDIIAQDNNGVLVFIEVKALKQDCQFKRNNIFKPEDHFDHKKQQKLRLLSQYYSNENRHLINQNKGWRVDLIAIAIYHNSCDIRHYRNV